jgi:predicted membrane-bound dolichyl-phosphate-mannose-protein mannosyltransferase
MDFRETQEDKNSSNGGAQHVSEAIAAASLLLILFVTLSVAVTLEKSPTADEGFHLVAGYSYLKWRDFRINPEHPPLAKVPAALPLLALNINDAPPSREQRDKVQANRMYGWLLANRWLFAGNDAEKLFFYAKLPMILLGAILGIFVFCWARDLYGCVAGIAALSIYWLDPNIIAHASIVHTDIPFALFLLAGTYFFWRTLRDVTRFDWSLAALFFRLR